MLNGRLYRAAFVPFLFVLLIAAFSLRSSPQPYISTLAPDAFEGEPAFAELRQMLHAFPLRRPGDGGDEALAQHVAQKLEGLGGTAGGGFSVHTYYYDAQTIDGERSLSTVIAQRPGSTDAAPILLVAHRDSYARGAAAELSATAALIELARVFSTRETKRTIVLASTSGGSGGDAGAARLAEDPGAFGLHGPFDAAIVVGDLAGARDNTPVVVPYSEGVGSAPLELQRTTDTAIAQQTGAQAGAPSVFGQLAHLAFPLTVGEQGVLDAGGIPAVLVQVSGEDGSKGSSQGLSAARLEAFGRAVLNAVDALDSAPNVSPRMQTGLLLQHKILPAWALELLVLTLLAPPAALALDGLTRMRRRRTRVTRYVPWALSCALPFVSCVLFVYVLGWLGVLGARPGAPALPSALPLGGRAITAVVAVALTFAMAWLLWNALVRRLRWRARPDADAASLAVLLVALGVGGLVWLANPFCALLVVPGLHLLVIPAAGRMRGRRALALLALAVLPLIALIAFYADQLGLGVGTVAWIGVQVLAGGHVGLLGALLWSLALGCVAAAVLLASRPVPAPATALLDEGVEVTIRGPLSYAGPGSLGGTESALRR